MPVGPNKDLSAFVLNWVFLDNPCPPIKIDALHAPVTIHTERTGRTSNAEEVYETVFADSRKSAVYEEPALSRRYPS